MAGFSAVVMCSRALCYLTALGRMPPDRLRLGAPMSSGGAQWVANSVCKNWQVGTEGVCMS